VIATGTSAAQWSVAKADGTGHLTDSREIPERAIGVRIEGEGK